MNLVKKIIFPLCSAFLLYRSVELIKTLISTKPEYYSLAEILLIAFLLNLFITGVFAFIGFAYTTYYLLPKGYYKIHNPNMIKKYYNMLGVKYFKIFLLVAFWGKKSNRKKYFDGTKNGFDNFIFQTKQSEFGHFGSFIVLTLVCALLLINNHFLIAGFAMLINIIGNLYPVILQRFHRMRIEKISSLKTSS